MLLAIIVGDSEQRTGGVTIKNLKTGQESFSLLDSLVEGLPLKVEQHRLTARVNPTIHASAATYGQQECKEVPDDQQR